tara:strand:- start:342311 stop:342439 length:129 start_codon:yes stop_codon:yes gene_type:complete
MFDSDFEEFVTFNKRSKTEHFPEAEFTLSAAICEITFLSPVN